MTSQIVVVVLVGLVVVGSLLQDTRAATMHKRSLPVLPDEPADIQMSPIARSRLASFLQWLTRGEGDYSSELRTADKRAQYKRVKPCYWSLVSCYKKKREVRSAMRQQQLQGS